MQSSNFTQEVLRLTNDFRQQNGVDPLTLNEELTTTADNYSETMAEDDFFSHIGKDGSAPWDRAEDKGYTANAIGENIAAGYSTPEQVVQGWIDSPGHRDNMLNPAYKELGVGYHFLENDTGSVNYNHYWTQLFGSGDLTPDEPVAPIPPEPAMEPDFIGDGGNNKVNGNQKDNSILGLAGNDKIKGRKGNDFMDGGLGNDRLWGGAGSDTLIGGLDNDILVGGGYFGNNKNLSDIDTLTGGDGADKFVLGNRRHGFYTFGGADDYALITDLTVAEGDTIQLSNQFSYSLGAAPGGTAAGQGLFVETNGGSDLIAVIQGDENLALTDNTFVYK